MTALGPIGALAICDVQTVRVFSFDAGGSITFAGTASSLRVRVPAPITAALTPAGTVRELAVVVQRNVTGALSMAGVLLRSFARAPLRFAKRKGIVTRGIDR